MLFKKLSPKQEDKFRKWARDNYGIGSPINDLWHPIVREECNKMNAEKLSAQRVADHVDGYDRDDLGESPDY